jgi:putative ABC transport system permease protein
VGSAATAVMIVLVQCAALLLSPWRVGSLLRTISIPRLREHALRTGSTIVGIALGIAVVIAILLVNKSILASVAATIDDIGGKSDLQISAGSSGFEAGLFDSIRAVAGVARATMVLEQPVGLRTGKGESERLLLLGVDFLNDDDDYFRAYGSGDLDAVKSDPFVFLNSPNNIILSRSVARRFGYQQHDQVTLQTPSGEQAFDIWGLLDDKGVGRAFGGAVAVMDYRAMQIAFDRGNSIDRIDVAVAPGVDVAIVADALRAQVGPAFAVERPARKNDRVAKMLASLQSGLTMASLVALLVGAFLIHNTMSISVVQRRREIGILRALGTTRRDLVLLLTLEGLLLGVVGAGLGALVGVALARALLKSMTRSVSDMFVAVSVTDVRVDHTLVLGGCGLGVVVATCAAALATLQAARSDPVQALRAGALVQSTPPAARLTRADLLGAALLVGSVLLVRAAPPSRMLLGASIACGTVVLGGVLLTPRLVQLLHRGARAVLARTRAVEVRMGNENLPRDIWRTSATAAALMVGVAMATSFAAFVGSFETSTIDWVDQMLPADLWITSGGRMAGGGATLPIAGELAAPLAELPDVEEVERVRMDDIAYQGYPIKLVASEIGILDRRAHLVMLEGTQADAVQKMRRGAVAVAENFSRRFNVHAGQKIALGVRNGTRLFDVCAVIVDYTSDTGLILLDRDTYLEHWGDTRVDTFKLYLRRGADPERTRRMVNDRFGDRYSLFVLTNREFREQVLGMLDEAFAMMRLLEIIAIVIAVLGVVNALLANALDRVRELAIVRAVGMLRRQVRTMVMAEGFFVGIIGAAGGVVLGLGIGRILLGYLNVAQTGWFLPYRPSWGPVIETALLIVTASALAGWYPASKAAALVIADALEYE